jgi:hypothetical protein
VTNAVESDAVLAFIRDNQARVLSEAIDSISAASYGDLPQVVHAAYGSVGSYQLPEAHARIAELNALLKDPTTSVDAVEDQRLRTLDALRTLEASLTP